LYADIIKIYAIKAKEINNTIYLDKPVIIYKDYIIQSKKAKIANKKIIYLNKDIVVFYKNTTYLAQKAEIFSKKI